MAAPPDPSDLLASLRSVILGAFPDLEGQSFALALRGWDSIAVDVGDRLIFKFPRHEAAAGRLRMEARLLGVIRPGVTMPVPDLAVFEGPPLFSRHTKLAGEHLTPDVYEAMSPSARTQTAGRLAQFYAELHALERRPLEAAGAGPIGAWLPTELIARKALPRLPDELRPRAAEALHAYERLPRDPHGETFGFFDGHGWNMAFDAHTERLNGVYDFGDSGIGPLHQEFIYSNLISFDLTERIVTGYETLTGRQLDRARIDLLTGMHGLSELAELDDDPVAVQAGVERVLRWLERGLRS